jgi:hypothetical protein
MSMLQPNLHSLRGRGVLSLLLVWAACSLPLLADDAPEPSAGRTWTVNGNPIQGKYAGVIGTEVLINVNNRVQRFDLSELSSEDLAWIWDVKNALGDLDDLPVEYRVRPEITPGTTAPGDGDPSSATQELPVSTADLRDTRTWTDRDGNTIQGTFSSIRGEELSILVRGQGWQEVHLAQLARNDLIWLQNALRNEGRLSELSLVFRDPPDVDASDSELVRQRRQGGMRQWKLYNGQTFVGAFHRVADGIVQVYDNEQSLREEHWNDLSDEDHTYLKERLARETPADFFPDQRDLALSTDDQAAGMRIWTDRERNQIVGSFLYLAAMNTVAVFNTPAGEARYIYEYIGNDDQAIIQGVSEQNQQTQIAQGGTGTSNGGLYSSNAPSGGRSQFPSGGHAGASGISSNPGAGSQFSSSTGSGGANSPAPQPFQSRPSVPQSTPATGPITNTGVGVQDTSAYDEGAQQGLLAGRTVWAIVGVVCLIMLIRKVSR